MALYRKHLSEPWFSLVALGIKTVEGRLYKGDFSKINIGDVITFYNDDFNIRECTVVITKITRHKSFDLYLRRETLKKCLPTFRTVADGLNVYYKYFTREQEEQYGIVAFHMELHG